MYQSTDLEIETLSSPITIKVTHYKLKWIKYLRTKTPPDPNFEEQTSKMNTFFQRFKTEGICTVHSNKITLIPKPDKER